MTAFGLVGNAIILRTQIQDVKADHLERNFEIRGELKEVKGDVHDLVVRQGETERRNMFLVERLLKDCGRKK